MTLVQDAATREAVAAALNGGSQQGEGAGRAGNGDGLFGADDYLGYGADHLPNNEWPSSDDEDELQNHRQWSRLLEAFPTVDPALTPLAEKVSPKKQGTYFDKQREFYTAFEGLILYLARGMATGKMPDCSCRAGEDRPFKVYCIDILSLFFFHLF